MRRLAAVLATVVLSAGVFVGSASAAQAAPCGGTYTIVVGGFNDPTSGIFTGNVSQRVGYSAQLTGASAREGVNELNRLIRDQRAACPRSTPRRSASPRAPRWCTPGSPRTGRPSTT